MRPVEPKLQKYKEEDERIISKTVSNQKTCFLRWRWPYMSNTTAFLFALILQLYTTKRQRIFSHIPKLAQKRWIRTQLFIFQRTCCKMAIVGVGIFHSNGKENHATKLFRLRKKNHHPFIFMTNVKNKTGSDKTTRR